MTVRPAEERDLPKLLNLSEVLFRHLKSVDETKTLTDDENLIVGATIMQTAFMMQHPADNVVMVMENERGITGFLCGRIEVYPPYYTHPKVAAILSVYPMADSAVPMLEAFDDWGKSRGATRRTAYMSFKNDLGIGAMIADGMTPSCLILAKDY